MENASVPLIKKSLSLIYEVNRNFYSGIHKDRGRLGCLAILACLFVFLVLAASYSTPDMDVLDIAVDAAYTFFTAFLFLAFCILMWATISRVIGCCEEGKENGPRTPTYVKHYLEDRKSWKCLRALIFRYSLAIFIFVFLGLALWTIDLRTDGLDFRPARFVVNIFLDFCFYFIVVLLYMIYAADELTYPSIRSVWSSTFKPLWRWDVLIAMAALYIPVGVVGTVLATALGVYLANLRGYL